jgi:hypothetical protein
VQKKIKLKSRKKGTEEKRGSLAKCAKSNIFRMNQNEKFIAPCSLKQTFQLLTHMACD